MKSPQISVKEKAKKADIKDDIKSKRKQNYITALRIMIQMTMDSNDYDSDGII